MKALKMKILHFALMSCTLNEENCCNELLECVKPITISVVLGFRCFFAILILAS